MLAIAKRSLGSNIIVHIGKRLPYGSEIRQYSGDTPEQNTKDYETDLLFCETTADESWKPRLIIECKIKSITTHDAITYSQKAISHKSVHPYLRYGIMIGGVGSTPLPGRLYRHGTAFDFMMSFGSLKPTKAEADRFGQVVDDEIEASRQLERIVYDTRKKDRDKYTLLHRKLHLE